MNDMTVAQPINGSRGATVAGPRNIPLEAQVPDIFSAPLTDHGSIPNLHFPFAFAHNRLEDGGWAREVTVREMPAMKELAIVNMRLGPGAATFIFLVGDWANNRPLTSEEHADCAMCLPHWPLAPQPARFSRFMRRSTPLCSRSS
jgi:hypothetical protein